MAAKDGTWKAGIQALGLQEGGVDYAVDEWNKSVLTPEGQVPQLRRQGGSSSPARSKCTTTRRQQVPGVTANSYKRETMAGLVPAIRQSGRPPGLLGLKDRRTFIWRREGIFGRGWPRRDGHRDDEISRDFNSNKTVAWGRARDSGKPAHPRLRSSWSASTRASAPSTPIRNVNLRSSAASSNGIVGENGAGKSTLMSILYGFYEADAARSASTASRCASAPRRRRSATASAWCISIHAGAAAQRARKRHAGRRGAARCSPAAPRPYA